MVVAVLSATQPARAAPRYFDQADPEATRRVAAYLASKDCTGALAALNEGIKAGQRDVLLLAGTMYETGLCIKADWERAAHFYQLADAAGNRFAIYRLASGYAVAGRDNAVALWWMAHRPGAMPRACIPAADPEKDIDGFEKALAAMPQALLKGCIYMTGVYASVLAETEFPAAAIRNDVYGDVDMEFHPASGTIGWFQGQRERASAPRYEDGRRKIESTLLTYMRRAGERTLARYQKPDGIAPDLLIIHQFSFVFE